MVPQTSDQKSLIKAFHGGKIMFLRFFFSSVSEEISIEFQTRTGVRYFFPRYFHLNKPTKKVLVIKTIICSHLIVSLRKPIVSLLLTIMFYLWSQNVWVLIRIVHLDSLLLAQLKGTWGPHHFFPASFALVEGWQSLRRGWRGEVFHCG